MSIVALIANIITVIVFISVAATFGGAAVELLEQCEANPTGTVEYQGQQFNCEDLLQGTN